MTKRIILLSILLALFLPACVGTAPEAASEPPSEVVESTDPAPTATTPAEASATEPDWLNHYGKTADNRVYLGNPDAPVTMIDYSDFM